MRGTINYKVYSYSCMLTHLKQDVSFSLISRASRTLRGATQPIRMPCVCVCVCVSVCMCVEMFFRTNQNCDISTVAEQSVLNERRS